MFYVHTMLNLTDYKLVDFTSKEEQRVSRDEIIQRVESGETIVGVVKINDIYVMREKGGKGKLSLEDYAILTDKQYLIGEFDCEKNGTTPDKVSFGSEKKVNWICPKGHSYASRIIKRTCNKTGCPYCAHQKLLKGETDFETYCKTNNLEYLLDEWDYEKNSVLPSEIFPNSHEKVFWLCPEKKHSYQSLPSNRVNRINCPYCAHKKIIQGETDFETYCKTNNLEYLLDEWDYEKNSILPNEIFPKGCEKIFWLCPEKKHSYESLPNSRINGQGCPYCHSQTSFPEQAILYYLSKSDLYVENRFKCDGKYEIDIYLPEY